MGCRYVGKRPPREDLSSGYQRHSLGGPVESGDRTMTLDLASYLVGIVVGVVFWNVGFFGVAALLKWRDAVRDRREASRRESLTRRPVRRRPIASRE